MTTKGIAIHYNEIALKGKNRPKFEKMLYYNIERATQKKPERYNGRLILKDATDSDKKAVLLTPGVAWAGDALIIPRDINLLKKAVRKIGVGKQVEYDVKRVDKKFEKTSLDLKSLLQRDAGLEPKKGGFKMRIDIMTDSFIISYNIKKGLGGLPIGSAGKALSLFSGGIDSSIAPIEIMKRGCKVDLLHIYAFPNDSSVMESKIGEIARLLSKFHDCRLYIAPFYVFATAVNDIDPRYELVLFKRFLLKLAEAVAIKYGYKALVTGDSLSQVASQTLDNINAISFGIDIPVFRPLIAYNKDEIIDKSKTYNTYLSSIKEYKDCCSLTSKHPSTSATQEKIKDLERQINIEKVIEATLKDMKIIEIKPLDLLNMNK